MKHPQLKVEKREVLGKKVKKLRRKGILPANVYGPDVKSQAIQLDLKTFTDIYAQVGETGLIDLEVSGKSFPVLIKSINLTYPTRVPIHVDFFKVNLKEKVRAMIPLVLTGDAPAVLEKIGMMIQPISEVEVEALPADLPENIEVSIEKLAELDQHILISDLKVAGDVTILSDPSQTVVKISELVAPEPEPEPEEETAEGGESTDEDASEDKKDESDSSEAEKENSPEEKQE